MNTRRPKYFKSKTKKLPLPVFFPDATRAVLRTLDSEDIKKTFTPGILVNTYHIYRELGTEIIEKHGGIREFMNWYGGIISDSGGFQVMTLAKKDNRGEITDEGVVFVGDSGGKILLTPEKSIQIQMSLKTDMVVVLDEFTEPNAKRNIAEKTVERTIKWAKRSKDKFEKICKEKNLDEKSRPYILAVAQGGEYLDLRKDCIKKLVDIGFDGMGYGGWPIDSSGKFNLDIAKVISENTPPEYFLYGLGVGKPEDIVACAKLGFSIFDCVLPTRDARHKRLYVYKEDSIEKIDIEKDNFYEYYTPDKEVNKKDVSPVSYACDCLLCSKYTRAYLTHLFKIGDYTAQRLSTIHNLRFYSILMEKLLEKSY